MEEGSTTHILVVMLTLVQLFFFLSGRVDGLHVLCVLLLYTVIYVVTCEKHSLLLRMLKMLLALERFCFPSGSVLLQRGEPLLSSFLHAGQIGFECLGTA